MTGVDPLALAKAENDAEERNFAVAEAIEKAFRKNGVAFIEDGENGFGPGVRLLRSSEQRRSIRPEDLNSANDG
ncbi:hypothetical protein ABID12_003700 [Martelella mangrovi]|uniref:DNA-binding protein n=2 Tax=Martelella mangrovi TaxID=1397477 RepID=A0ABV2IFM5_9HYPH